MITAAKARERQMKFKAVGETLEEIGKVIEHEIDSGGFYQYVTHCLGSEERFGANPELPALAPENILLMKKLQENGYKVEYRWANNPYTPAAYQGTIQEHLKYDHLEFLISWSN